MKVFAVKLALVDSGNWKEAVGLEDLISSVVRKRVDPEFKKVKVDISAAAGSIDALLNEKLASASASSSNSTEGIGHINVHKLTSHERTIRRNLIKDFYTACASTKNCNNCGAYSPKIRQDNSNKIFQSKLSAKLKKMNMGQNIKIRSAMGDEINDDDINGDADNGWDSDDSDVEMEDEEDEEPVGDSTMSDDDEETSNVNDMLTGKKRESRVSASTGANNDNKSKPDKFMHGFEVEAQVKLTWKQHPLICSKVFGNAHCFMKPSSGLSTNNDPNGYSIFFMRAIPVPPSRFRPPMVMGTMTVEHAQNHYLNKVLELNDRLRLTFATVQGFDENKGKNKSLENDNHEDGVSGMKSKSKNNQQQQRNNNPLLNMTKDQVSARALSTWIDIQTTINCYIDSSKDPSAAAANNVPNGIRQLLEKKEGIFRKHMMGKRVNFACRSVISPDPYIGTNEIGIPLYFAQVLTYPTPVTARNVAEMRKLVIRGPAQYPGARWVELPNGRRVELTRMQQTKREAVAARLLSSNGIATVGRQLRDGDMVLMNRQVCKTNGSSLWCFFGGMYFVCLRIQGLIYFEFD